jgi:CBS domain containing-hemolysin-like protein
MEFWSYIFDILVILLFVFLNGFFVASEFAIVKVRLTQLEPLVQKSNWRAKIAKGLVTNLNAYLSATQLGITMTSLALGWIGEPLVAQRLLPFFSSIGIFSGSLVHAVSFALAFSIITFLHIVLGELAPKSLAILEAKKTALWISYPLSVFYIVFKPVILLLNSMANGILRILGFDPVTESERSHSEEELRLILVHDMHGSSTTRAIALNAIDFHQKQARHAMVPRKEIVALSADAPAQNNLSVMRSNKFSRYPVYKDTIDNVIGIVYTKDIYRNQLDHQPSFNLHTVLRDAIFLPETATLETVLDTIRQKKTHMILLADEYGGTAGLITLENVLEELVGNIQDEYDREAPEVVKINENEFIVAGDLTTNDVEQLLNIELSPLNIRSIGGFIVEQLGHIPSAGERMEINGIEFTADKIVDNAVETVRIRRLPRPVRENRYDG